MKKIRYFVLILLIFKNTTLFAQEYVILLHGLWRTSFSMQFLDSYLKRHGFGVINLDYPSNKFPIQQLSEIVAEQINRLEFLKSMNKVHFVTHSMGGIVVRAYLAKNKPENLGRVVMLSPPNKGCELATILKHNPIFRFFTGPAGQQIGIEPLSFPNQLGPVNFETGVIIGNISVNPILSYFIPGEDDGKISVKNAKVNGMKDFLVVPHSHPFIMNSTKVREKIVHFLKYGNF